MSSKFTRLIAVIFMLLYVADCDAQIDTLTIGQAYDWQIGDTFIYQTKSIMDGSLTTIVDTVGFSVISRQDSGTSIFYTVQYFDSVANSYWEIKFTNSLVLIKPTFTPFSFGSSIVNIVDYVHHNEIHYIVDPVLGNTTTGVTISASSCSSYGYSHRFSQHVGLKAIDYFTGAGVGGGGPQCPPSHSASLIRELIYYRSGNTVWTDVTEIEERPLQFSISPNPADDVLHIRSPGNVTMNNTQITICNIAGRVIISQPVKQGVTDIPLNISSLAQGMYIISIINGESKSLLKDKFIKQ